MPGQSPFRWKKPPHSADPTDEGAIQFGYREENMLQDLARFFALLKRGCDGGPKMRCLHADLLDGFHGAHYETHVDDANGDPVAVDAAVLKAGNGITITRDGSNLTFAAINNGDVTGPGSSTDHNLPQFNGATGKAIEDSGIAAANVAQAANTLTAGRVVVGSGSKGVAVSGVILTAGGTDLSGVGDFSTAGIGESAGFSAVQSTEVTSMGGADAFISCDDANNTIDIGAATTKVNIPGTLDPKVLIISPGGDDDVAEMGDNEHRFWIDEEGVLRCKRTDGTRYRMVLESEWQNVLSRLSALEIL